MADLLKLAVRLALLPLVIIFNACSVEDDDYVHPLDREPWVQPPVTSIIG